MKKKNIVIGIVGMICICVIGYFGWQFLKPKPEIIFNFNEKSVYEYGEKVQESNLVKDCSGEMKILRMLDTSQVGTQTVVFEVEQEGYKEEFQKTLEVKDTKAPEIKIKKNKVTVELNSTVSVKNNVESVSDPVDGKIEYKKEVSDQDVNYYTYKENINVKKAGTYKVEVLAKDKHGNETKKSFDVVVLEEKKVEETKKEPVPNTSNENVSQVPPASSNGKVICIDAGHQGRGNNATEAVGPGSSTKKAKVAGGATGVSSRRPESEITLEVAMKLRTELQNRGYTVIMTRTSQGVNLSNQQRASIGNKASATIHIHCDSASSSARGAHTIAISRSNPYCSQIYNESSSFAKKVINAYCKETGIKSRGVSYRNDLTGLNWSKVPAIYIELGFISNKTEDQLLNDSSFQKKMVRGMANGIDSYFN